MSDTAATQGFIIAAPASGSGKTILTLSLLRAFRHRSLTVGSFKVGPDYIDPGFHTSASGRHCLNIDPWAMRPATLADNLSAAAQDADILIGEGVMGLFDGTAGGSGSTADVAEMIGAPIVLVVDASGQAASAAALVHGFRTYRPNLDLAGVIFNRVGSTRHRDMLSNAMRDQPTPVFGYLPRNDAHKLPERHLGLVPAAEHDALDGLLDTSAQLVEEHVDLDSLANLSLCSPLQKGNGTAPVPPLGQRIAIARDDAFAFAYPHILAGWREAGSDLQFFSPLANDAPPSCDAIFLPGGYPELHAGPISANDVFLGGLGTAAEKGTAIYGECGGFMVLGNGLTDADGRRHTMAGLLPLETSFADRRLHLGYRDIHLIADSPFGRIGDRFRGHEFHYATVLKESTEAALFKCQDAQGTELGSFGCARGNVSGSFLHLVDRRD